jgi:hypothetical protein
MLVFHGIDSLRRKVVGFRNNRGTEMQNHVHWIEIREEFYQRHFGPLTEWVWHSNDDKDPHVDVYVFRPWGNRDYWTLVTGGMSNLRQAIPEGAPDFIRPRTEILLYLNKMQPWAARALKRLAEYPFEKETFLCWWHSISNGEPIPILPPADFNTFFLLPPYFEDPQAFNLLEIEGDPVSFLWAHPITDAELRYKEEHGGKALDDLLMQQDLDLAFDAPRVRQTAGTLRRPPRGPRR